MVRTDVLQPEQREQMLDVVAVLQPVQPFTANQRSAVLLQICNQAHHAAVRSVVVKGNDVRKLQRALSRFGVDLHVSVIRPDVGGQRLHDPLFPQDGKEFLHCLDAHGPSVAVADLIPDVPDL